MDELGSHTCLQWRLLCFISCPRALSHHFSLGRIEVEDVFNSYASFQLLIMFVLGNQKESKLEDFFNSDCSPQERVEDKHIAFPPIFFIFIVCVLSSHGYNSDLSTGNKLSVVRVVRLRIAIMVFNGQSNFYRSLSQWGLFSWLYHSLPNHLIQVWEMCITLRNIVICEPYNNGPKSEGKNLKLK